MPKAIKDKQSDAIAKYRNKHLILQCMKVAIMQPYFFPYIGYWQLINAVDIFVILDDVNYINRGWINRNKILVNGKENMFTIPLNRASQNLPIKEITLSDETKWRSKLLKTIEMAYKKAPYFKQVFPLLNDVINYSESNLSQYIGNSLIEVSDSLNITTQFLYSSEIKKESNAKGQDKILDICNVLNAETYINSIGGAELYSRKIFKNRGINLFFLKSVVSEYKQFNLDFIPGLSVIDQLMFESPKEVKRSLASIELI